MPGIFEEGEPSSIEDYERLACHITFELRQVIDTLEMLVEYASDVDEEHIALVSTPCVLIKALWVTVKKTDDIWSYFLDRKSNERLPEHIEEGKGNKEGIK